MSFLQDTITSQTGNDGNYKFYCYVNKNGNDTKDENKLL